MPKRTCYAECEGKLYVEVKAVMTPIVAVVDGLPVTFFGRGKKPYLAIEDAIGWCRAEQKYHSPEKYAKMIKAMEHARKRFAEKHAHAG